jgi:hypothetical protein
LVRWVDQKDLVVTAKSLQVTALVPEQQAQRRQELDFEVDRDYLVVLLQDSVSFVREWATPLSLDHYLGILDPFRR